ncbi:MAG TPA: MFS transporter [Gaiellaceae bacterium]|nr:MFS transporter [Gaiellaceae bacterium]
MSGHLSLRRAHLALAVVFVAFGTVDGTWAARLPALEHRLALDSGELGLVIFSVSGTATLLLVVAGWLSGRFGSRGPAALGLSLAAAGLVAAAFAPAYGTLVGAACVLGAGFGVVDVAANAHGVALEGRVGRPILSALHGMWSVGLLLGSAVAAGAAAVAVGPRGQFPAVAAGVGAVALVAVPRLLPGREDAAGETAHFALPRGALALPAFLTFCSMFLESSTMNWSAVFLAGPAHAGAAVAAAGVVAFSIAMALSRFVGDRLLLRWGVAGIARRGGLLSCLGVALAVGFRTPAAGLVGFALVGAGCAAIVPVLFRVAGSIDGVSAGAGIAAVATAGYTGGVVNGPAIGFLARGVGLSAALGLIAAAGAAIALLGPRLDSSP